MKPMELICMSCNGKKTVSDVESELAWNLKEINGKRYDLCGTCATCSSDLDKRQAAILEDSKGSSNAEPIVIEKSVPSVSTVVFPMEAKEKKKRNRKKAVKFLITVKGDNVTMKQL